MPTEPPATERRSTHELRAETAWLGPSASDCVPAYRRIMTPEATSGRSDDSHAADSDLTHTQYILVTECLQNDLFVNRDCRLYLGDQTALWTGDRRAAEGVVDCRIRRRPRAHGVHCNEKGISK